MANPVPQGVEINPFEKMWSNQYLSELVAPQVAQNINNLWIKISTFFTDHALIIFIIIFVLGALNVIYKVLRKKQYVVQKLWHFILFFLSKRQMMIPLLCTLGQRESALSDEKFKRLLELRDESRKHSLKTSPKKRLKLEAEISEILFHYFDNLEKTGKLRNQNTFGHIVKDLEYIDQKLVELQGIYNGQATKWNKKFGHKFLHIFGLKTFQLFG